MISMAECHLRRGLLFLDGGDELVRVGMGACDSTVQLIVPSFYGIVGACFFRVDVPHAERKVPVQPGSSSADRRALGSGLLRGLLPAG